MAPCSRGDGLCSPRQGMVNLGSRVHPTPPPRPAPSPPTSHRPNKGEPCSRTAGAGAGGQLGAVVLPASGRGGRGLCWGTLAAPGFPSCPLPLSRGEAGRKTALLFVGLGLGRYCLSPPNGQGLRSVWGSVVWRQSPRSAMRGTFWPGATRGGEAATSARLCFGRERGAPSQLLPGRFAQAPELWFGLQGQGCPGAATGTGRARLDSKRPSERRTEAAHTGQQFT